MSMPETLNTLIVLALSSPRAYVQARMARVRERIEVGEDVEAVDEVGLRPLDIVVNSCSRIDTEHPRAETLARWLMEAGANPLIDRRLLAEENHPMTNFFLRYMARDRRRGVPFRTQEDGNVLHLLALGNPGLLTDALAMDTDNKEYRDALGLWAVEADALGRTPLHCLVAPGSSLGVVVAHDPVDEEAVADYANEAWSSIAQLMAVGASIAQTDAQGRSAAQVLVAALEHALPPPAEHQAVAERLRATAVEHRLLAQTAQATGVRTGVRL